MAEKASLNIMCLRIRWNAWWMGRWNKSIGCHTRWDISWIDKCPVDSQAELSYMQLVSVNNDGISPNDEMFNRIIRSTFKENCIESFHLFLTQSWTLIGCIWRRQYAKCKKIDWEWL